MSPIVLFEAQIQRVYGSLKYFFELYFIYLCSTDAIRKASI